MSVRPRARPYKPLMKSTLDLSSLSIGSIPSSWMSFSFAHFSDPWCQSYSQSALSLWSFSTSLRDSCWLTPIRGHPCSIIQSIGRLSSCCMSYRYCTFSAEHGTTRTSSYSRTKSFPIPIRAISQRQIIRLLILSTKSTLVLLSQSCCAFLRWSPCTAMYTGVLRRKKTGFKNSRNNQPCKIWRASSSIWRIETSILGSGRRSSARSASTSSELNNRASMS